MIFRQSSVQTLSRRFERFDDAYISGYAICWVCFRHKLLRAQGWGTLQCFQSNSSVVRAFFLELPCLQDQWNEYVELRFLNSPLLIFSFAIPDKIPGHNNRALMLLDFFVSRPPDHVHPFGDVFCELRETGPKQVTTNVPRIANTAFQQHAQDSVCSPDHVKKIAVDSGMILLSAQMTTDAIPSDRPENRFGLHHIAFQMVSSLHKKKVLYVPQIAITSHGIRPPFFVQAWLQHHLRKFLPWFCVLLYQQYHLFRNGEA